MQKAIVWSLALAVAAVPVAAAAEAWKDFVTPDGYASAVATDSIKTSGTLRYFRLRAGKIGDPRYAIADVMLDCQSKLVTIGRAELYDKGVRTGVKQADPAHPFTEPMADQPSGDQILALVCTG
jgi:hypothetical protein